MFRQGELNNHAGDFGVLVQLLQPAQHLGLLGIVREMVPAILNPQPSGNPIHRPDIDLDGRVRADINTDQHGSSSGALDQLGDFRSKVRIH